jgi:hypothetical protein
LIAGLSVFLPASPAQAQANSWTAASESDLMDAINGANTDGGGTITVTADITLTSALPAIDIAGSGSLLIEGSGETINGNNACRVFEVDGGDVTIENLTVADGNVVGTAGEYHGYWPGGDAEGGGLLVTSGNVTINGVVFSNDLATGGNGAGPGDGEHGGIGGNGVGGAVYNAGTLTVTNSTFSSDTATGGVGGNASEMAYGGNGGNGEGGAIYNTGTLTVNNNNTFTSDTASGGVGGTGGVAGMGGNGEGGAIYNTGTITIITNGTFSSDTASGGKSGQQSYSFSGGGGNGEGGAIYNTGTLAEITGSMFSSDTASGGNYSNIETSGGNGNGGAVYNTGTLNVTNSTFSSDTASGGNGASDSFGGNGDGGAAYNAGALTVTNGEFSGDAVSGGGGGAPGNGRAASIYNQSGAASVLNVTLDSGSSITYGAINIDSVSPTSVTANGTSPIAVSATVYNSSSNPVQGVSVTFSTSLGSLGAPSPVITNASGLTTDTITSTTAGTSTVTVLANGYPSVSICVYFTVGPPASITPATGTTPQSAAVGTDFGTALQAKVVDNNNNPVSGAQVTFTAPSSGAGGTFANGTVNGTVYSATTDAGGVATASAFTANATAGGYTVTASVDGVGTPADFVLTNTTAGAPGISGSNGSTDITTSDQAIVSAGDLSVGQYVYYTTNGNTAFAGPPSSVSGCVYYQGPFSLPQGTDSVAAAVYSSGTGLWGDVATTTFTVNQLVSGITVAGANGAISVASDATLQMDATVSPADASNKTVTWSVTPVTGNAIINSSGLLTGTAAGTVTVTAMATDGSGISGSTTITVTTANITSTGGGGGGAAIFPPTVQTVAASAVAADSAVLNGDIVSDNSLNITDYGFLWGTGANSLTNKLDVGTNNQSGTFTDTLSGLTAGTTYYFQAYATNSYSTADGAVLSFTASTTSSQPTTPTTPVVPTLSGFSDVQSSFWGYNAINNLNGKGFVSGYPDGTFKPGNQITRAEFCAIMDKVLNLTPSTEQTSTFTDVNATDWFNQAVETAVYAGIAKGYGDGTFHPNAPISRQEIACVLVQALGKSQLAEANAQTMTKFVDDHSIAWWSRGYIYESLQQGIINGYPDNTFKPGNETTRAEACAMVSNFLKAYTSVQ